MATDIWDELRDVLPRTNETRDTTVHELIDKEELDPSYDEELSIENVGDLDGIGRFTKLKRLKFGICSSLYDFEPLAYTDLTRTLEEIRFDETQNLEGIDFLIMFESLKRISLFAFYHESHNGAITQRGNFADFSALESPDLEDTVEEIEIGEHNNLKDISVIRNYKQLWRIHFRDISPDNLNVLGNSNLANTITNVHLERLYGVEFLKDWNAVEILYLEDVWPTSWKFLGSKSLAKSVKSLTLQSIDHAIDLSSLSFLRGYKQLEELVVINVEDIEDVSGLSARGLKKTLRNITLNGVYVDSLSWLRGYQKLSVLNLGQESFFLSDSIKIDDYTPLSDKGVAKTLEVLDLQGHSKFSDLSLLDNYKVLRNLDIKGTSVRDISYLLNHKRLESVSLPSSVDWTLIKDGRFVNTETVQKLQKRGVKVELPDNYVTNTEIEPTPSLYIICGPSGAGKTTLVNYITEELGTKQFPKVTTRPQRPGETGLSHLPYELFEQQAKSGLLQGVHEYRGNLYAMQTIDIVQAKGDKGVYMADFVEIEPALQLRDKHPDLVKIILLLPFANMVEHGLTSRLMTLEDVELSGLTFEEQVAQLQRINAQMVKTRERIENIGTEYKRVSSFEREADYVIGGLSYTENISQVRGIITGEVTV